MLHINHSSGDLVADRRAAYADALARERCFAEAAEVMEQVLELAPRWAAGWGMLARYHEEQGRRDAAIAAWQQVGELDPAGIFGARLALAAHGVAEPEADKAYVAALFDDYAPRFERSLVDKLGYRVPELLGALMRDSGFVHGGLARDLGCGTGLMGPVLRGMVERLEGVDLSARMLGEARRKGLYDRLVQADLLDYLATEPEQADLITASDVLNYVGPLPPVLAAAWGGLARGGRFAFSLEAHDGAEAVAVRPSLRFAHGHAAARAECERAGFDILVERETVLRSDRGQPVAGYLMVLGKR